MKQVEAQALAAQVRRDYPGRIRADIERGESKDPEGDVKAALTLIAEDAPRLARRLRYPSQLAKAREAWCLWLLTEAELAALPFPGPDKDDEDEAGSANITTRPERIAS